MTSKKIEVHSGTSRKNFSIFNSGNKRGYESLLGIGGSGYYRNKIIFVCDDCVTKRRRRNLLAAAFLLILVALYYFYISLKNHPIITGGAVFLIIFLVYFLKIKKRDADEIEDLKENIQIDAEPEEQLSNIRHEFVDVANTLDKYFEILKNDYGVRYYEELNLYEFNGRKYKTLKGCVKAIQRFELKKEGVSSAGETDGKS